MLLLVTGAILGLPELTCARGDRADLSEGLGGTRALAQTVSLWGMF